MNSSEISLREATSGDMPALLNLLRQLFSIEEDFTFHEEAQRRGLNMMFDEAASVIVVAEQAGKVVGMATVQSHISTAWGGRIGIVEDLVVLPELQGQGIGRRLLAYLTAWSRTRGFLALRLLADRNNQPALGFYTHLHWKPMRLEAWQMPL